MIPIILRAIILTKYSYNYIVHYIIFLSTYRETIKKLIYFQFLQPRINVNINIIIRMIFFLLIDMKYFILYYE